MKLKKGIPVIDQGDRVMRSQLDLIMNYWQVLKSMEP